METEYYSFLCYDGVERTFKCQSTQTLEEDMVMHFEVDSDIVAVTSEGTEDIDIMGDEYTESREEDGSLDFDNMRKSVSFRKTPVELIVPAKYVDDEYGVESAPESSSDKEEYPTREEYTNREWINKPISNWINDTYVNIPNILDQVDSFKNVKDEQNVDNNFNFPYILQVVKDICCRNNLEKLKLTSLAQTYAKRIATADGIKNCKFCGRILSSTLTKSLHLSNEEYCCDRYHRLFRLAVNYSEMLYKRYRQQRRDYNRQKLNDLIGDTSENRLSESGTKIVGLETELLNKPVSETLKETIEKQDQKYVDLNNHQETSDSLADTTGNTNNDDNEENEYPTDRIVYQLSNRKYIEQGWTAVNHVKHNDGDSSNDNLLLVSGDGESMHNISDKVLNESTEIQLDFIQHTYSNGEVFLRKYNDNTGVIFYPTGNPAILFLPSEINTNNNEPVGLLFIVHDLLNLNITKVGKEDAKINHKQKSASFKVLNNNTSKMKLTNADVQPTVGQLIGVFDSNIHGVVYDKKNNIRLQYNHNEGVYFKQPLDRYTRVWKWSGEKHVHAPPFQPLLIKLNDIITLKIYRFNKIHLHFQTMKIICKLDLTSKQLKLQWINTEQYREPK